MTTKIFYFSATGNSLTTARMLSKQLTDNCELVSMVSLYDLEKVKVCAEVVGIVFPVYLGDLPYLVRNIIERMVFLGTPYIFSVSTYRKWEGYVARRLDDILKKKGQKLSYNYLMRLPGNSTQNTAEVDAILLHMQEEQVTLIAQQVKQQEIMGDYKDIMPEQKPTPFTDGPVNVRGMVAEEHCVGCGTCVQVCPMNNIQIQNMHALIGNNCITCLSCFHWCPVEAIIMSKDQEKERRPKYHHPDIVLQDIIAQKNN